MTVVATTRDDVLARDTLAHLEAQLESARHLLDLILQQGRAIRARDVDTVLRLLAAIQAEVERRTHLEAARTELLTRAGHTLGLPAGSVTLKHLTGLMAPAAAQAALDRSAELTGLLGEVAREHGINRALMRQELTFLSHLTRLIGGEPEGGYRPPGATAAAPGAPAGRAPAPAPASGHRLLDLKA